MKRELQPKYLIDEHGVAGEGILGLPHQVEVGQPRLHHQHVRPLRHVPSSGALGQPSRPAGKLVLFTVTKGRGGLGRLPERSVEAGGELDGVAEDGNPISVAIVGEDLFEEGNFDADEEDFEDENRRKMQKRKICEPA